MEYKVAIIGRPNVGKSTLFNRLVGKRLALVDDQPGVTRDRREGTAKLYDITFTVIDTAGLEEAFDDSLEARMRAQTEQAVEDADLAFLIIDARAGVTPMDEHFAKWLRRTPTPVFLLANKCEGRQGDSGLMDAYRLGLGEPVPMSAEHGLGMTDLYDVVDEHMKRWEEERASLGGVASDDEMSDDEDDVETRPLQLAIVGRPNVGKSTLINRLLGEDRLLTGPEAGITRDSIGVEWTYGDRPIKLFDTAGIRRRPRVQSKVEKLSVADSLRAIKFAQVVVLVLDADAALEKQDLTIARMVEEEGRALVLAVNKWDACRNRNDVIKDLRDRLERSLPQLTGVPVVTISALRGQNLDNLLKRVFDAYKVWNKRISTSALNRWLDAVTSAHPPPAPGGRRIRLKYMTQAKSRPPTFAIFCTKADDLPLSYGRYLENALRDDFDLYGTPIRLNFRKGDNPYAKDGR
ncbi:ribosome biogenesis GTPase Der [Pelagibius sp. Alg239-R121]|uniref:ribosome biogenesis GTPase Der n=1 Tax=Pelagibius sp. Alg239-R121 TaxID=2993448 RepID=UPI0024A7472E|nr:ribosome biogenesis GTPase Der [Pelagibius sp. Alg239-R121]